MNKKNPIVISLFSGAMGLDLGLEKVGFKTALANEFDPQISNCIRTNRPMLPLISRDIREVTGQEVRKLIGITSKTDVDLVVGGPPCQAFSVYGKRRGTDDPRGAVIYEFLRMVKELNPKAFLMENVRGLLSMKLTPDNKPGSLLRDLQQEFGKLGYRTDCFIVNAVNYGAPQIRERLILIGNRYGLPTSFPDRTHSNVVAENLTSFTTLGEALASLKEENPVIMDFSPRKKKYLSLVKEGGNWRSLPVEVQKESMGKAWYLKGGRSAYWRRLSFEFPSPTVVTMPNHAGTSMCHPHEIRALTVRECARIQGFPDEWQFVGSPSDQYKQVGNAVPVKLGEIAGIALRDLLSRIELLKNPIPLIDHNVIHIRPHVRTRQYYKNGNSTGVVSYSGNVATLFKKDPQNISAIQLRII